MAHISLDIPSISQARKKELINELISLVSEIAEIDENSISVSIHELPLENMNGDSSVSRSVAKKEEKEKPKQQKEEKKKSFFKEMFP